MFGFNFYVPSRWQAVNMGLVGLVVFYVGGLLISMLMGDLIVFQSTKKMIVTLMLMVTPFIFILYLMRLYDQHIRKEVVDEC